MKKIYSFYIDFLIDQEHLINQLNNSKEAQPLRGALEDLLREEGVKFDRIEEFRPVKKLSFKEEMRWRFIHSHEEWDDNLYRGDGGSTLYESPNDAVFTKDGKVHLLEVDEPLP